MTDPPSAQEVTAALKARIAADLAERRARRERTRRLRQQLATKRRYAKSKLHDERTAP